MKNRLKALAAVTLITCGSYAQAQDQGLPPTILSEQQQATRDEVYGGTTSDPANTPVQTAGGEGPGAPLPINNFEYALLAAGIAIAGYAVIRSKKQNA